MCDLPGAQRSKDPDGDDDEQRSHPRAGVSGSQGPRDDVVSLETDGQDGQHWSVSHRVLDERN